MDDDFDEISEPELTADEEALLKEMPTLADVGWARRTFLGQTITGGLGIFALVLLEKEQALAAFEAPPDALFAPATASITLRADGTAHVTSATSDIGPGTYTVMTMIAAEYLGLRMEQVKFELGDTKFPRAPSQGGSQTTASVGSAVHGAALAVTAKLLALANRKASSPLKGAAAADVEMLDGRLRLKSAPSRFVSVSEVMRRNGLNEITETFESKPSPEREKYST